MNTACYSEYYPNAPDPLIFTYDDANVNRRSFSLSSLPTAPGLDRDEVPMNKVSRPALLALCDLSSLI